MALWRSGVRSPSAPRSSRLSIDGSSQGESVRHKSPPDNPLFAQWRRGGGTGIRVGLKNRWSQGHESSILSLGTFFWHGFSAPVFCARGGCAHRSLNGADSHPRQAFRECVNELMRGMRHKSSEPYPMTYQGTQTPASQPGSALCRPRFSRTHAFTHARIHDTSV